ncbi:MAG: DNA polymerase III subunit alpha [Bacteroidota bacterium]
MPDFIHLHNHSHFSLLDGAATIDGLVGAAVENKMPAVALTDHGVMFGAVEFLKTAKQAGVKPILGCECYIVTNGNRFDKSIDQKSIQQGHGRGIYHHLVLLAKNLTGYRNLMKLCTLAHTEGFYYKPRIDLEILRKYSEGLIALSACPAGVVSAHIIKGDLKTAQTVALTFKEIFGDEFYLEIQDHGLEREKPILAEMPKIAKELGIKLIATNDVHYIKSSHALAHNVMLMIPDASISNITDYHNLRYQTDQLYFKSSTEMCKLFKDYPDAIENTLEVAEKIEKYPIGPDKPFMPKFPIPPDAGVNTLDEYMAKLSSEGLKKRYPTITSEIQARFDHELSVITKMGYSGYFLITQDFINASKQKGISVGPGRGSAAGSIVSYALGITDVDPLKYDLLFERFLNPDRVSMPDIDVDFADNRRDEVINYVKQLYGNESVSQIITFGTLSSRAVIKDVGRVLGVPLQICESITKQIPVTQGRVTPIAEAIETIPELKWVKDSTDDKIHDLIEISKVLEGMNRNSSTHAAGVVIAPGPISDYVPIYKTPQTEPMTQYNMSDLEKAGLLKMDFLGLRTLTIIENALNLIKENLKITIDLNKIPEDDSLTFELFGKSQTIGVFQFESSGMRDWLRKLKPTSISDLVAMNALYRPGPMEMIGDFIKRKQGTEKIHYLHAKLEPILKETYGIIVYQEQVIKIASEIAGFSLAKADLMRRAMGKKDKELMAKQKVEFIDGAVSNGFSKTIAAEIFDMIDKFASYGFNKSHSVAYSIIAYRTAYLKAHFTAEYMAACLSAEIGDTDYVVQLIEECRKMDIAVLPPDINESNVQFVATLSGIRFGLSAIKNVGVSAVENIIKTRDKEGIFKNIFDFCQRVDLRIVNKKTLEGLIQAGAFDSLSGHRAQLFETVEKAIHFGQVAQGYASLGQTNIFEIESTERRSNFPPLPEVDAWTETEKLSRERNALGFFVSGHPLLKYEMEVNAFSTAALAEPDRIKVGSIVRICGIITQVKKKVDKKGNTMAFFTLQDFTGKGECIAFSDAYRKYQQLMTDESMVMVIGKCEPNGDSLRVFANEIYPMEQVRKKFTRSIIVSVKLYEVTEQAVSELRRIAQRNRGTCNCYINVITGDSEKPSQLYSTTLGVDPNDQFIGEIEKVFGQHAIKIS